MEIVVNLFTRSIALVCVGCLAIWTIGWLDHYPPAYRGLKGHLQHAPMLIKAIALVFVLPVALVLWAVVLFGPPWQ